MAASVGDLKGYDHDFLEPPPDDLFCLICLCVAREPQQINCCGKVLCNGCLKEHQKRSNNCPQCRKPINSFADKRSEKDILSLKIRCDKKLSNGCEWVGELRYLDKHMATCSVTLLPCPNKCHKSGSESEEVLLLSKDMMEEHIKEECPRRQYKCPHCQEAGEYQEITTKHLHECPMIEVSCPRRKCKVRMARCHLSKHRQECMFEKVPCKYTTIGCKEHVLRKDLREHEGNSQHHLQLAIDTVHQQQSMLADLQCRQIQMPMKYQFTRYNHHKTAGDSTYSPAFYTSPGGYKMCIRVSANGSGEAKGTHVSVYAYLMKGQNDDHLPWPFTGTVTVELLNQLEDENHHSTNMTFHPEESSSLRVASEEISRNGWGHRCYIAHSDLGYNAAKNCQYLKKDCLYFKICVDTGSSIKPWLI